MTNQYYIVVDGNSTGPFSKEGLMAQGINRETLVWREGMSEWAPASSVPELTDMFVIVNPGGFTQPNPPHPQYGPNVNRNPYSTQQQYQQQYPQPGANYNPQRSTPPYNWMTWAIVGTIVGFFTSCIGVIFGIIGIVQANKANTFYAMGDYYAGDSANSTAKIMTIISLVISAIGIITTIILLGSYAAIFSSLTAL